MLYLHSFFADEHENKRFKCKNCLYLKLRERMRWGGGRGAVEKLWKRGQLKKNCYKNDSFTIRTKMCADSKSEKFTALALSQIWVFEVEFEVEEKMLIE